MRDNKREQRWGEQEPSLCVQIDLPAEMVQEFGKWWDSEGWWSFRAWHERHWQPESEWERFMRHLWGGNTLPAKRRPVCADEPEGTFD